MISSTEVVVVSGCSNGLCCLYGLRIVCYCCLICMCVVLCVKSLKLTLYFCASRAMSPDELVYLGILAASIPAGFLFRYLSEYFGQFRLSTKVRDIKYEFKT